MIQQATLSDYFWTHIYNNPDIDKETLDSLMPSMGGRAKGADNTMRGCSETAERLQVPLGTLEVLQAR